MGSGPHTTTQFFWENPPSPLGTTLIEAPTHEIQDTESRPDHNIIKSIVVIIVIVTIIIIIIIIHIVNYVYIIDQAQGQDGWILAEFSFCVFMDRDEVKVHKKAKRERGQ